MLTIRDAQMEAFDMLRRDAFVERAVANLQSEPRLSAPVAELRAAALAALDLSARYGIQNEFDVMLLVGLCRLFGPRFEDDPARPWARALLAEPGASGTRRVRALWDRFRAEGGAPR